MAYTKTTWTNDSGNAINATNLNKIETGIKDAHDDIAALSIPADSDDLNFTTTNTGGVARSLTAKFDDFVSVKDFGAAGNGTDDDTSEIQAALDSGETHLYFPPGVYICSSTLTLSDQDIVLRGAGIGLTEIRFTSAVNDGITITQNSGGTSLIYITEVHGMSITTGKSATGAGLLIDYSSTGALSTIRNHYMCHVSNLEFTGSTDEFTEGWYYGLHLKEVQRPLIENITALGYRDNTQADSAEAKWWPHSKAGIYIQQSADLQPTLTMLRNIRCSYQEKGVWVAGTMEGLWVQDSNMVACKDGIYVDLDELVTSDGAADPHITISGCHVNVGRYGIYLANTYANEVKNNLVYRFARVNLAYYGIHCSSGNYRHIHGNQIFVSNATGSPTGDTYGIYLNTVNQSHVHDNMIADTVNGSSFNFYPIHHESGTLNSFVNNQARRYNGAAHQWYQLMYWGSGAETDNYVSNQFGVVASGEDSAGATVDTSATVLVTSALPYSPAGAKYRVTATLKFTKTTAGYVRAYVQKSAGTSTVTWGYDNTQMAWQQDVADGEEIRINYSGVCNVTASGSLSVTFYAICEAGTAAVTSGDADIVVERIV